MGELILYQLLRSMPVCPSTFLDIASETTGPIELKTSYGDSLGWGKDCLFKRP